MLTQGFLKVGTTFYHLTSCTYNPSISLSPLENDGFATAGGQVALSSTPYFELSSNDLDAMLDDFDLIANALTGNGVKIYYQHPTAEGVRETNCSEYSIAKGIMTLETITLAQGAVATATLRITPISTDGIADPVSIDDAVALPSVEPLDEACTLGAVAINGTAVDRVQSVDIQLNNSVNTVSSNGGYYPTFAYLNAHSPAFTISGVNSKEYTTLATQKALRLNGTNGLSVTIRKTANGVVTSNTAKTLTIKEGLVTLASNSSNQGSLNNATLNVAVSHNRTDATPILVS
jgi:hypothetical protein